VALNSRSEKWDKIRRYFGGTQAATHQKTWRGVKMGSLVSLNLAAKVIYMAIVKIVNAKDGNQTYQVFYTHQINHKNRL